MGGVLFNLLLIAIPAVMSVLILLTSWILKEIIGLKLVVSDKHARFEEQMDDNGVRISDHEARIRRLEAA